MIERAAFLFLAVSYPFAPASAQHSLVLEKLEEWNGAAPEPGSETLKAEILKAAGAIYETRDDCTTSAVLIEQVHPATAERFVFSAILNRRLRNAWTVTARLPGCDHAPARYMVMQNIAEDLSTVRVNRGISYAWDSLFGDTLPLAHLAALAVLAHQGTACDEGAGFRLGVTRVAAEAENLGEDMFGVRYEGSWSEVWPIEACDRTVEVTVNFTADGDGGAFLDIPGEAVTVVAN